MFAWPYVTVEVHGHVGATFRLVSASRRLWRAAGGSARGRERPTGSERRADNTNARSLLVWDDLMRRAFDIDALACPQCGGAAYD